GFLFDGGVHAIATIRKIIGAGVCTAVSARTRDCSSNIPGVPDTLNGTLFFANGSTALISLTYGGHPQGAPKFAIDVVGKHGRMELARQRGQDGSMSYDCQ
ncbi:hypothetical protein HDU91_004586, partial [Kappamyces sp. JEL0680]